MFKYDCLVGKYIVICVPSSRPSPNPSTKYHVVSVRAKDGRISGPGPVHGPI